MVIIVLAIFLTGCHTIKYEWFPKNKKTKVTPPFTKSEEEPSPTIDVLKVSF
ncbi:uncharacterized protein METZ01_LOCUS213032 [marine metagenome]|uniref:Lipoprotein n=1 Tax=marine metagenome TaxID=408172 RepID=A0A382FAQ6_9ZZZZ